MSSPTGSPDSPTTRPARPTLALRRWQVCRVRVCRPGRGGGDRRSARGTGKRRATLTVGYFTGLIAEPETVIGSTPSLAADIPAHIKWIPITAGVTGLAEVRAGAIDAVAGVGNPPTVAAISNGTLVRRENGGFDKRDAFDEF